MAVEENVRLGLSINGSIKIGPGDVCLSRPASGTKKQAAAASAAKSPLGGLRGIKPDKVIFTPGKPEFVVRDAYPGDVTRTMFLLTHPAVTMSGPTGFTLDTKPQASAQAATFKRPVFHDSPRFGRISPGPVQMMMRGKPAHRKEVNRSPAVCSGNCLALKALGAHIF